MKAANIKALPKEFDFKSNINPYDLTYHAKETKYNYEITWDLGEHIASDTYSKKEFRRRLLKDEFVICQ